MLASQVVKNHVTTTKMHQRNFFKMVRITFEKYFFEVQKSEKKTLETSILVKQVQKYFFFQKMCACARGGIFFCTRKNCREYDDLC